MRGFVLLCLVLAVVDASGDKKGSLAEIVRKILLVTKDAGWPYHQDAVESYTEYLKNLLNTISKRGGIDIAQKIKEQDNNVLNIKENNPRGPEFDKVVSTAKEILDKLVPKAHANEELDLRTSYALLKILSKNEVNDRIRGNLKKMNKKFDRLLNEIIIYKDVGKKKQIYSIMDDVENLLDVLSGPKMTEKQYREAVKKIEHKLGKKKQ